MCLLFPGARQGLGTGVQVRSPLLKALTRGSCVRERPSRLRGDRPAARSAGRRPLGSRPARPPGAPAGCVCSQSCFLHPWTHDTASFGYFFKNTLSTGGLRQWTRGSAEGDFLGPRRGQETLGLEGGGTPWHAHPRAGVGWGWRPRHGTCWSGPQSWSRQACERLSVEFPAQSLASPSPCSPGLLVHPARGLLWPLTLLCLPHLLSPGLL